MRRRPAARVGLDIQTLVLLKIIWCIGVSYEQRAGTIRHDPGPCFVPCLVVSVGLDMALRADFRAVPSEKIWAQ